jgi:hypothetical protein
VAPAFDPIAALRSLGFLTPDDAAKLDELASSQYFLVRIDATGERWRCRRCNGRHAHFTSFCVELPYRGLQGGLYGYWKNVGAGDPRNLSVRQRARVSQISQALGLNQQQTNLSTLHPQTARALGGDAADVDVGADLLGTLDPISESKARLLADLINSRAGARLIVL